MRMGRGGMRETYRRLLLALGATALAADAIPSLRHSAALLPAILIVTPLVAWGIQSLTRSAPGFAAALHTSVILPVAVTVAAVLSLWDALVPEQRPLVFALGVLAAGDLVWQDVAGRAARHRARLDAHVLDAAAHVAGALRSDRFYEALAESCASFLDEPRRWVVYVADVTEIPPSLRARASDGFDPAALDEFAFRLGKGVDAVPQAILTDEIFVITGPDTWYWCSRDFLAATELEAFVVFPFLGRDDAPLGALLVEYHGRPPSRSERASLDALRRQVAVALENRQLYERVEEMALRDELTGLYNARFFRTRLQEEISHCRRRDVPLTLALLDLDRFKSFNDTYGHLAGDRALRACGQTFQALSRAGTVVARYGGEEFVVLAPAATVDEILVALRRLTAAVAALDVRTERGTPTRCLTLSAGVASLPDDGDTAEDLLEAADRRLYAAKDAGRDRVVAADRPHVVVANARR